MFLFVIGFGLILMSSLYEPHNLDTSKEIILRREMLMENMGSEEGVGKKVAIN